MGPVAVCSTYRRLASKLLARHMSSTLATELQPVQIGVGVNRETAVHAVQEYAAVPRITYLLRAPPTYVDEGSLQTVDELMREAVSR